MYSCLENYVNCACTVNIKSFAGNKFHGRGNYTYR